MPDRAPPATGYQLRAVVHGVSPLIWRRLLVPGDTTIAVLHAIVQAAFDWSGEYLHRFHGARHRLRHLLRRRTGFPRRRPPGPPGRPGTARGRAVYLHLQLLRRLAAGPARGTDHRHTADTSRCGWR